MRIRSLVTSVLAVSNPKLHGWLGLDLLVENVSVATIRESSSIHVLNLLGYSVTQLLTSGRRYTDTSQRLVIYR